VMFYEKDKLATTIVWSNPVEKTVKSQRMEKFKVLPIDAPDFDTCGEMLLAGSGNSVYIRDIRVRKKEKIQIGHEIDSRSYECCTIF